MQIIISAIIILFFCLIIVALKYDRIIPPLIRILKKPPVYISLSTLIILIVIMQDWGMVTIAPIAESSEKYGFPVSRSVFILAIILAIGSALYFLIRTDRPTDDKLKGKICLKCMELYEPHMISSGNCPKCSGTVEDISGVLDRNPELLNNMKSVKTYQANSADAKSRAAD